MSEYDVRVDAFDGIDARTAYLLWQLRAAVFVVEQQCCYLDLDGRDLEPTTRHVWVADGETPIAYLRLLDEDEPRIGRVVVATSHRGLGLAGTLMRRALGLVGERRSHLHAQSYLADWYTRFGYRQTGPEFLDDGIPHVPMTREATPV